MEPWTGIKETNIWIERAAGKSELLRHQLISEPLLPWSQRDGKRVEFLKGPTSAPTLCKDQAHLQKHGLVQQLNTCPHGGNHKELHTESAVRKGSRLRGQTDWGSNPAPALPLHHHVPVT